MWSMLSPIALSLACATSVGPVPIAPIAPDRPDVTNGPSIVEVGLLQVEGGVQHVRMGTQHSTGTPLTVRIGLLDWLEARVSTDGFLHQSDGGSSVSGTGNVQLVSSLGADQVVDYKTQEFENVLSGYDVVLGTMRGDSIEKSVGRGHAVNRRRHAEYKIRPLLQAEVPFIHAGDHIERGAAEHLEDP